MNEHIGKRQFSAGRSEIELSVEPRTETISLEAVFGCLAPEAATNVTVARGLYLARSSQHSMQEVLVWCIKMLAEQNAKLACKLVEKEMSQHGPSRVLLCLPEHADVFRELMKGQAESKPNASETKLVFAGILGVDPDAFTLAQLTAMVAAKGAAESAITPNPSGQPWREAMAQREFDAEQMAAAREAESDVADEPAIIDKPKEPVWPA